MRCFIGLDDTDSSVGGCTTYLGYRLVGALLSQGCSFHRYPRLVRLNPNVPFKTRGNAAVGLEFETERPSAAFATAVDLLCELSDAKHGANSGAVFLEGKTVPAAFRALYEQAVSRMVNPKRAERVLKETGTDHVTLGNGMGLVGAASALGFSEEVDHTYEAIAYRTLERCGTRRSVDGASVERAEREHFPDVFGSYDHGARRVLVAPHGPDPVFIGVRAASPGAALDSLSMVRHDEPLEGHMVYVSNQCTDAHLKNRLSLPLSAYSSGWLEGAVRSTRKGPGGHVYLAVDVEGLEVPCAVYAPSGDLLRMAQKLSAGDVLRVFGGVRPASTLHPAALNVEKIEVLSVAPVFTSENPACEACGRRMKSEGRGKGYQCRGCGARLRGGTKVSSRVPRELRPGIYLPSPGAQRHLTKQLVRYGRELRRAHPIMEGWISPEPVRPLRVPAKSPR